MSNFNQDKERKGGFWSALSGLFGGGGAPGAGVAGGLFATKAGIVGMVLGGATIAAGVGVVYNFVGSSSKPVYSPELFQNSYYEEESAAASQQRAQERDRSAASASTLDLFSEQAKKEGLVGGMGSEAGEQKASEAKDGAQATAEASAEAPEADGAPAAPGAAGAASGGAKLAPAAGFSGGSKLSGGGSSSSIPRMQNQGGMSGGIGGQFSNMYRPPAGANDGRINGLSASRSSAKSSPKYAVPNFKKSGAYGQAKVTNARSKSASYSADASGARSTAEAAFSGETGAGGDVGGMAGAGMGGAGISQGTSLKASDPNMNKSEFNVPSPNQNTPKDVSPWNDLLMDAMWWGLGCIGGIITTRIFANLAKKGGPYAAVFYGIAVGFAYAAMAAAAVVIGYGVALMLGKKSDPPDPEKDFEGQTMYGLGIIFVGLKLMMAAMDALAGCEKPQKADGWEKGSTATKGVDANGKATSTFNGQNVNQNGWVTKPDGSLQTSNPAGGWASGVTTGINDVFKGL